MERFEMGDVGRIAEMPPHVCVNHWAPYITKNHQGLLKTHPGELGGWEFEHIGIPLSILCSIPTITSTKSGIFNIIFPMYHHNNSLYTFFG
jgi:hypothetical protein